MCITTCQPSGLGLSAINNLGYSDEKMIRDDDLYYLYATKEQIGFGEPVYLSDGVWLRPPPKPKPYINHCWHCHNAINSENNSECPVCHWYICSCDACKLGCERGRKI